MGIPIKMSETEVKTDAPTAEEIKGTKRSAEDEIDAAKKQKTENGANGANGKAVEAEENGAEVEEEEDVDEEDEEALGEEEEGEGEEDLDEEAEGEEGEEEEDGEGEEEEEGDDQIFLFVVTQPRHFVLHIPNTPPHHHLCSTKKGANRERLRQFKKYPNPNARNARPIPYYPQNDRTSVEKTKKKVSQEMVFSLKQNKKESFLPPFKTKN